MSCDQKRILDDANSIQASIKEEAVLNEYIQKDPALKEFVQRLDMILNNSTIDAATISAFTSVNQDKDRNRLFLMYLTLNEDQIMNISVSVKPNEEIPNLIPIYFQLMIARLSALKSLKTLVLLGGNVVIELGAALLSTNPNITSVSFVLPHFAIPQTARVDLTSLGEVVRSNKSLESIVLCEYNPYDLGNFSDALADNSTLKKLSLYGVSLTSQEYLGLAKALSRNQSIVTLEIMLNQAANTFPFKSEYFGEYLSNNRTLRSLNLSHNELTLEDIRYLFSGVKNNKTLEYLDLSHSYLDGSKNETEYLRYLQEFRALKHLNMEYNALATSAFNSITFALNGKAGLKVLQLNNTSGIITRSMKMDGRFNNLAHHLQNCKSLRVLELKYNYIDDIRLKFICQYLQSIATLETLDIENNEISSEGVQYLLPVLKSNQKMQTLNIRTNSLKDKGFACLASGLIEHPLEFLLCSDNEMTEKSGPILCELIKRNKTLSYLDVSSNPGMAKSKMNQIGDASLVLVAKALSENQSLTTLMLDYNNIGKESAEALLMQFKISKSLQRLTIRENFPESIPDDIRKRMDGIVNQANELSDYRENFEKQLPIMQAAFKILGKVSGCSIPVISLMFEYFCKGYERDKLQRIKEEQQPKKNAKKSGVSV